MRKPLLIASLAIPVLLIISGLYFKIDLLTSTGCVVLIFFIIMLIRGKLGTEDKQNNS